MLRPHQAGPLRKWTISCLARWRMAGPRFLTQNRRMELEFTTTKTSIPLKAGDEHCGDAA